MSRTEIEKKCRRPSPLHGLPNCLLTAIVTHHLNLYAIKSLGTETKFKLCYRFVYVCVVDLNDTQFKNSGEDYLVCACVSNGASNEMSVPDFTGQAKA